MDALKNAVAAAFDKVVASGAIETAIETKLNETISSAISEHLRSYSDFGKELKEKVSQAIGINLKDMDLPSYGDLVLNIIRRQLDAQMESDFAKRLEANMAALLAPAPAEITVEAIIEAFIKTYGEDKAGEDFTLLIETKHTGFTYISLDKESDTSEYSCDFRIGIHNGEVFSLALNGDDTKKKLFIGPLRDFEKLLFQLHTAKTKVIMPADISADDYPRSFPYND